MKRDKDGRWVGNASSAQSNVAQGESNVSDEDATKGCMIIIGVVIFVVVVIVGIMTDGFSPAFEEGDRVVVTKEMFALRNPAYSKELSYVAMHKDEWGALQLMYDGKIRSAQKGTRGRVIMMQASLVEVVFEDDPVNHWWIDKEFLKKLK